MRTGWSSSVPDTRKIELLHKQVEELDRDIADIRQDMQERFASLQTALSQAVSGLRGAHAELVRQIQAAEHRAARVDARGIWPIGFGILLTGIPGELAAVRAVGIIVVILALTVTVAMIVSVRIDTRKQRAAAASATQGA